MRYLSRNEIAIENLDDALEIIKRMVLNDNVCVLSREEDIYIINYEWVQFGDRNGIVFRNRDEFEMEEFEESKE